jgi:ATP-binding cassette subfamily B protein
MLNKEKNKKGVLALVADILIPLVLIGTIYLLYWRPLFDEFSNLREISAQRGGAVFFVMSALSVLLMSIGLIQLLYSLIVAFLRKVEVFRTLKPYLWKYSFYYKIGLFSLIFVNAFQLVVPQIMRTAVNELTFGKATSGGLLRHALIILALAVGVGIMRFFWRYLIIGASRKIEFDLRNRFYQILLQMSVGYFNKTKVGDLMALATNDLEAVRMMAGMSIVALFDSFFMLIASLVLMATINWKLTLFVLIPMPFLSVIFMKFGKQMHDRFKQVQESFAKLTDKTQETFSGIRVIKAYVQELAEFDNFQVLNDDYRWKNMYLVRIWGLFDPLIGFVIGISFGLVLLLGGDRVILSAMSMGDYVAFTSYLGIAVWPMIAVGWIANLYQRGKASMGRLNEVFDLEPDIIEPEKPVILDPVKGDIEFRNLTFAYDKDSEPVLKGVSMKIPAGSTVALVGKTGSGKTTVLRLILRLFDVSPNSLFIDGNDLRDIQQESFRKQVGMVPQESFLFSEPIMDNIKFGQPDASDAEAIEMAKVAQIYDNVMEFPRGFDTMVGERGVSLSGGQKQRISIARALLVKPRILILDDALSAVDTETEEKILHDLKIFMKNRTNIIVSHRISTVKNADRIFVIDMGKIAEEGTHDELLAHGGIYADLDRRQKLERMLQDENGTVK